jgi:hypothetical protein
MRMRFHIMHVQRGLSRVEEGIDRRQLLFLFNVNQKSRLSFHGRANWSAR